MARVQQDLQQFTFAGGYFTDATPLTYPENTAQELLNFDLRRDGSARRRLGVNYENASEALGESLSVPVVQDYGLNTYVWSNAGGLGNRDIAVVQFGNTLWFFDATADTWSTSEVNGVNAPSVDIPLLAGATKTEEFSFASGYGVLFVVGNNIEPVYVTYDNTVPSGSNPFTVTSINIKIRDFNGIDDGTANDNRPSTLSSEHLYNLRNQGWPTEFSCFLIENGDSDPVITDPVSHTKNKVGFYPARSDIIHFAKSTAANFSTSVGSYSPWALQKQNFGNTESPKGRFILDAFRRDRSAASGVSGLSTTTYDSRPSACAFFAGRVWYSGMTDEDLVGTVYFSQVLTSLDNIGKCYQDQDPTAEQLNSLLSTDGGVIEIPDAGKIYAMVPYERSLVVVADNGIWQIIGSEDTGFTATTYGIRYVTNVGAISLKSVVSIPAGVVYLADSGIFALSANEVGALTAQNISDNVISEYYKTLSNTAKRRAQAFYDRETNKLLWLISTDDSVTRYKYNEILFLDLNIQAYYRYSVSDLDTNTPFISGVMQRSSVSLAEITYDVVLGSDDVVLGANDVVQTTELDGLTSTEAALKLLTFTQSGGALDITFSEFNNRNFIDWESADDTGVDYESVLITGYQLLGEAARDKQVKFWTLHFERTEQNVLTSGDDLVFDFPSAATCRVRHDFTSSSSAQRWSNRFNGYRLKVPYLLEAGPFDYSYDVISTKNRIRGHGKAVQFEVRSETGKDIRLLGWDLTMTGRSRA